MIGFTTDYKTYDSSTGSTYIELKSIETATPAKTMPVALGTGKATYRGGEIILNTPGLLHAQWRIEVRLVGGEAVAGATSTLKVEVQGADEASGDTLTSPETVFGTGAYTTAELNALKDGIIYDGLIPENFKRNYVQIVLTVGTAKFTAGKVEVRIYATNEHKV